MRMLAVCGPGRVDDGVSLATASVAIGGAPVSFALVERPSPEFDIADDANLHKVFVRVRAFSLNFRDKALMLLYSRDLPPGRVSAIGSEFVADVLACGPAVTRCAPGDRVIANAAYPNSGVPGLPPGLPTNGASTEFAAFHEAKLLRVPPSMPDDVAAAFTIGAQTTYSMVRRLALTEGACVLVTAARSNTSLFALHALRALPVTVVALTSSAQHRDRIAALGVARVVDGSATLPTFAAHPELMEIARERDGFDAVIDPFADLHVGRVLDVMGYGGRYITCGVYDQYLGLLGERFEYLGKSGPEVLSSLFMKNLTLIGNCLGREADLARAVADHAAGRLDVTIDSVLGGTEIAGFLERTCNAPERFGKVVFRYD